MFDAGDTGRDSTLMSIHEMFQVSYLFYTMYVHTNITI